MRERTVNYQPPLKGTAGRKDWTQMIFRPRSRFKIVISDPCCAHSVKSLYIIFYANNNIIESFC